MSELERWIEEQLDRIELLQAEIEQLRRERDTLDRFAMTEAWELYMDLPDHWYERDKHYAAVVHCEEVAARMAAAFVAAPSLDELLAREADRDG